MLLQNFRNKKRFDRRDGLTEGIQSYYPVGFRFLRSSSTGDEQVVYFTIKYILLREKILDYQTTRQSPSFKDLN